MLTQWTGEERQSPALRNLGSFSDLTDTDPYADRYLLEDVDEDEEEEPTSHTMRSDSVDYDEKYDQYDTNPNFLDPYDNEEDAFEAVWRNTVLPPPQEIARDETEHDLM